MEGKGRGDYLLTAKSGQEMLISNVCVSTTAIADVTRERFSDDMRAGLSLIGID